MEQLPAKHQKITNKQKGALAFVVVAFIVMGYAISHSGSNTSSSTSQPKDESLMAYIQAQDYVKRNLKSPSSAKFPVVAPKEGVDSQNSNVYDIGAYVDSQNSFGAMLRSQWAAQIVYKGGDDADPKNWEITRLDIDGNEIINTVAPAQK